jgi:hypothetical protein
MNQGTRFVLLREKARCKNLMQVNLQGILLNLQNNIVRDSGEGVCVDPGEREAILGTGGPGPPEKGKGQQLAPESGGEGT